MSMVRKQNKEVHRARASRAPAQRVLARGWRGKRGARSKMRVQRVARASVSAASQAAFGPALRQALGEPDRKLSWHNFNPEERT